MVKVLGDRVLLQQLPRERHARSASGWEILLPDNRQEEQRIHRVLSLGTQCRAPLKLGDLVLIDQYSLKARTFVEDGPSGSSLWIIPTADLNLMVSYEANPPGFTPVGNRTGYDFGISPKITVHETQSPLVSGFAPRPAELPQAVG